MFPDVKLVNGSGPHEGNILVGGLPVCDYYNEWRGVDWYGRRNALVVCRSYNNIRGGRHRKNQFGRTTILSFSFNLPLINLVRMLGFSDGFATSNSTFGKVNDTFRWDGVFCSGREDSLLDCPNINLTKENCTASDGAGVTCFNDVLGEA